MLNVAHPYVRGVASDTFPFGLMRVVEFLQIPLFFLIMLAVSDFPNMFSS